MAVALTLHQKTWAEVDRFIAVSPYVERFLREIGIDGNRVVVKPNIARVSRVSCSAPKGFLYAGRLSEEKGILLLLESWRRIGRADLRLTIVGDGPLRGHVEDATKSLPGLSYAGAIPRESVAEQIASHAVVIIPSTCPETLSNMLVESFAGARPVIATDLGAPADIVSSTRGWLVSPRVDHLSRAILEAAASDATAMGKNAEKYWRENFSPDSLTEKLIKVYHAVMS